MVVGTNQPGVVSKSPRFICEVAMPLRLAATRLPGLAVSIGALWLCSPRKRDFRPAGTISISCPRESEPSINVPVTTVPEPAMVNTRSIGSLGLPMSFLGSAELRSWSMAEIRSGRHSPVDADTAIIDASERVVTEER